MAYSPQNRVTAVLGPTNTGKTYLAIERMLGHAGGMIGFPLRLLARENYDRMVKIKGQGQVALVTGEEKIIPAGARYFCCTVESMPLDRPVEFLAVDEIQLCADPERGHVFTDRLLRARGSEETMFLGADTVRGVLQRLVPEAKFLTRPRFSTLTYKGPQKITRVPPRSAVVAFSAAEVYATAELLRRRRGGTAVVLGALSPQTRNAQVEMFEAGEVDYLVATDAIGMGLNLSLDHVAFSRLSKFDGQAPRRLTPAEIGQIAGRAGRHMSDGSFGTTQEVGPLDDEVVEAVETHSFDPLRFLFWRNPNLDFRSPRALLKSLEQRPPAPELLRARAAEDYRALAELIRDAEVLDLAAHPAAVRLLWEVCQIPDFRKILSDQHAQLLRRIYLYLMRGEGRLPVDWVAKQLKQIARSDGDIDQLVARISHIRTWTYITHRGDWLPDAGHWQEKARAIEDRLSDALHTRLTQRFVDRRAAVLVRRLRDGGELLGAVKADGDVLVEGEFVGRLEGFRFLLDSAVQGDEAKPLLTAARRALSGEIPARLLRLETDPDEAFDLSADQILWQGYAVARLASGDRPLKPRIEPLASDFLDGRARERLRLRLALWLDRHLRRELRSLFEAETVSLVGPARGLLFQLIESLGTLPRRRAQAQIAELTRADRKALAGLGLRLGRVSVFFPALLKPRAAHLRALLWCVHARRSLPQLPPPEAVVFAPGSGLGMGFCQAMGFVRFKGTGGPAVALRADILERFAQAAHKLAAEGSFVPAPLLNQILGAKDSQMAETILIGLGYQRREDGTAVTFAAKDRARKSRPRRKAKKKGADSPFAALRNLKGGT